MTTTRLPRLVLVALLMFSCLSPVSSAKRVPAPIIDLDRVIAIVNDDVITATELSLRLSETKTRLQRQNIKLPPDTLLKRQLLDGMVMEHIQLQLASRIGVRVSDQDVEQAIQGVARQNNMTLEAFYKALARDGLDLTAYRDQLRSQMTIRRLLEREINNRVKVADAEVDRFLENRESRQSVSLEFDLSHIFITVPESATTEAIQAAKTRADKIHMQLSQGMDFAQAAIAHSKGPNALNGGKLDWKKAGQLPELFLAALKDLQPGEFSRVMRGPNGFHILKLHDRRGDAKTAAVTQTHVRHILLRPSEIQSIKDARDRLLQLRNRIQKGEDFANLARTHSEDTTSASEGGDLGWVNPKQLVPEFEQAMNQLPLGELSEPVQSPFGLHLIQVLDRRHQDVTDIRERDSARKQIHARKADELYEQWIRQLRDEAYIEYLLEDAN